MKKLNKFISALKRIDLIYSIIAIVLLTGSALAYLNKEDGYLFVKSIFDLEDLDLFAGGVATIFTLTSKIKSGEIKFSETMSFPEFRVPFEGILSFIGNPVTIYFTITFVKGAFIYPETFFPNFQGLQLGFIQLVASYILYASVMEVWKNFKETTIAKRGSKGELLPASVSENEKVPPPLISDSITKS